MICSGKFWLLRHQKHLIFTVFSWDAFKSDNSAKNQKNKFKTVTVQLQKAGLKTMYFLRVNLKLTNLFLFPSKLVQIRSHGIKDTS